MGRDKYSDPDAEYESMHGTDKYITTWDRIFSEPSDVYADKGEEWFEQAEPPYEADLGEDYPRGV